MSEFDRAAATYDRTRRPPSLTEVRAVLAALGGRGRILDVATGTGRYALPLSEMGLDVVGVDLSRRMLEVARAKGLRALVQGDGLRLPFPDGTFDGALAVHALQAVPDPVSMLHEMARVARRNLVANMPPDPEERKQRVQDRFEKAWARYFEEAEKRGYSMQLSPQNEEARRRVLDECPPAQVIRVEVPGPFFPEDMTWEDVRDFSGLFTVPPEVHAEIVKEVGALPRQTIPDRPRVVELARWDAPALRRR